MRMEHKIITSRAFSLTEVIIAVALIGLGLIPVFSLFVSTTSDVSYTIDEVMALSYANEMIEAIVSCDYDSIPQSIQETELDASDNNFLKGILRRLSVPKPAYKRFVEITSQELPFNINNDLSPFSSEKVKKLKKIKTIKVSVRYFQNKRPRDLKLATIVSGA